MTASSKGLLRTFATIALAFGLLIFAAAVGFAWWRFHPENATPVIGPLGERNRAFIENRSFGDMSFVLCVSDWPTPLRSRSRSTPFSTRRTTPVGSSGASMAPWSWFARDGTRYPGPIVPPTTSRITPSCAMILLALPRYWHPGAASARSRMDIQMARTLTSLPDAKAAG